MHRCDLHPSQLIGAPDSSVWPFHWECVRRPADTSAVLLALDVTRLSLSPFHSFSLLFFFAGLIDKQQKWQLVVQVKLV